MYYLKIEKGTWYTPWENKDLKSAEQHIFLPGTLYLWAITTHPNIMLSRQDTVTVSDLSCHDIKKDVIFHIWVNLFKIYYFRQLKIP